MYLARAESAADGEEKARAMAEIGRIYATELDERSQALVAYTQAFCEDPEAEAYGDEVERLAGSDQESWAEASAMCAEASAGELSPEQKMPLFARLGHWYEGKMGRADLAVSCFQAILTINPNHEAALAGLSSVYQKAQQWSELAAILQHRASARRAPPWPAIGWPKRPRSSRTN